MATLSENIATLANQSTQFNQRADAALTTLEQEVANVTAAAASAQANKDATEQNLNANISVITSWPLLSTALELEEMARFEGQGSGFVGYDDFETNGLTEIRGAHGHQIFGVKTTLAAGDEYKLWMKSSSYRMAGITHQIQYVNSATRDNVIVIPDAPTADPNLDFDGSGKFTGAAGGRLTQETIVFPEIFWEQVGEKDFITFEGGVHHGATTYTTRDGTVFNLVLGTTINATPQAYFSFGLHDTTTDAHVLQWSTLTDAEKTKLINEQHLWIRYNPNDGLVYQRRYRVRTVPNEANNWLYLDYHGIGNSPVLGLNSGGAIQARGKRMTFSTETQGVSNPTYSFWWKEMITYGVGGIAGQIQTTLHSSSYSDIGVVYASLWARVSQRNDGLFHPAYNSNGTTTSMFADGSANDYAKWYTPSAKKPSTVRDCFESDANSNNTVGNVAPFKGNIRGSLAGGGVAYVSRPDEKYYDIVYADDVEDKSMWAGRYDLTLVHNSGLQALIQSSYRGWRGGWRLRSLTFEASVGVGVDGGKQYSVSGNNVFVYADEKYTFVDGKYTNLATLHESRIILIDETNGRWADGTIRHQGSTYWGLWLNDLRGNITDNGTGATLRAYLLTRDGPASAEPVTTVVLGDIANLPTGWDDDIDYYWMYSNEDGTSALPDGTSKTWKLPFWFEQASDLPLVLLHDSSAGTWSDVTGSVTINGNAKTITHTVAADDNLFIFLKTQASPWSFVDQVAELNIPDRVLIHAGSDSPLTEHLVGEPATMNGVRPHEIRALEGVTLDAGGEVDENHAPSHSVITIGDASASVGVKVAPTIANVNGITEQQVHFVELQYDSVDSDFADDGQLDIADQVATKTDAAASPRTVRIGSARRKLNTIG